MLKHMTIALALLMGSAAVAQAQQPPEAGNGRQEDKGPQNAPNPNKQRGQSAPANRAAKSDNRADTSKENPSQKNKQRANARREEVDKKRTEQREKRADRKEEKREKRVDRKEDQREKRADRKEEQREKRVDRKEEQREKRADRKEEKRGKRADRKEENREKQAERNDSKSEDRVNDRAERVGDRKVEPTGEKKTVTQERNRTGKKAARDVVKLDDKQRNRIREQFRSDRKGRKHYTNVNIEINVGRRLPRDWEYYTVPTFVIDVAPRYQGYRYVWVEDRYVIVEPDTYEVVAYIDADSGRVYATSHDSAACTDVRFSVDERRRLFSRLDRGIRLELGPVSVGFDLPSRYELQRFPQPILSDFGTLESCRYVWLDDNRIAVVAPEDRHVVAVITN